jgi:hypothetical protein
MNTGDYAGQEPRFDPGSGTLDAWRTRQAMLQLGVLAVAVAAAAVVVGWLVFKGDGSTAIPAVNRGPKLVTPAQLDDFAKTLDHPLYWVGPKTGFSLELTHATGGRIFVRYLPRGVEAGDTRPDFLSVGTYAAPHSFHDLKRASTRQGSVSLGIHDGGLVVFDSRKPTSVYFAYPDGKYQVEVFAPSGETARTLVLAGHVTPVADPA